MLFLWFAIEKRIMMKHNPRCYRFKTFFTFTAEYSYYFARKPAVESVAAGEL